MTPKTLSTTTKKKDFNIPALMPALALPCICTNHQDTLTYVRTPLCVHILRCVLYEHLNAYTVVKKKNRRRNAHTRTKMINEIYESIIKIVLLTDDKVLMTGDSYISGQVLVRLARGLAGGPDFSYAVWSQSSHT